MSLRGAHVRTIGDEIIQGDVTGIAASAEIIVVGTLKGKKVVMIAQESGSLLRSFGGGPAAGQLSGIQGLRFTPDGAHILITEAFNSRLSLFTKTGEFVRCITHADKLDQPFDVDFASNGDILVVDRPKDQVHVFSADGSTLLRSFGSQSDGDGEPCQLNAPSALAVHGDKLFVLSGESARVHVYN